MQWSGAAIIRRIDDSASLNQTIDDPHLVLRVPNASRSRSGIARVVQGSGAPPVDCCRIGTAENQKIDRSMLQCRGGEVERRVADVEPVRNGCNQTISVDGMRDQFWCALEDAAHG